MHDIPREGWSRGLSCGGVRPVIFSPDPVLQQVAEPVSYLKGSEVLLQLSADFLVSMYAADGCGLAAPQISGQHEADDLDSCLIVDFE